MVHSSFSDADELLTPQSPPVPHTHPLVALSDESARNVKLQQENGGMAIRSSERLLLHRPIVMGKRLDPTFLNRARVKAFTERESAEPEEEMDNVFAVETEHSSRAIALQYQRQKEEMEKPPKFMPLGTEERALAATEASARRRELLEDARRAVSASRWKNGGGKDDGALTFEDDDSALKRASERKVRKHLDPEWLQARQDPANRPKGPLERPEERDLREMLYRTSARDLLRSGVLYDEADRARNSSFKPMSRYGLPVMSSGIVGLAGCCFEHHDY
ncbi:unnamed protein product [Phytophthora fragariaefolia]|uniref:Unnamed protein product n=1 Tax=Phytophthora fragariaefolia TaxID=1490495 RepID=A0A9W6XSD0_9STRA|nr:unnamed protein product [Phytophthora fragariaefolia]